MFRKFVMFALSVSLLGFSIGCGGPGEVTTIDASQRPKELRQSDQPNVVDGEELPEGVMSN